MGATATAASHRFVDAPGRVYGDASLVFLDVDGGVRGIFLECEEIAWAEKSATRWSRSRAPAPARAGVGVASAAIDRRAVVARYPLLTGVDNATLLAPRDVFTLGNGDFAFNVDATGLQTFNTTFSTHGPKLDLNTLSAWGFHSSPACAGDASAALRAFNFTAYPTPTSATDVRPILLATDANLTGLYSGWSMSNPHRVGLGQISLRLLAPGASDAPEADSSLFQGLRSSLDTWGGSFSSSFTIIAPSYPFCEAATGESGALFLQCNDPAATIDKVLFASYGALLSSCPSPVLNSSCYAPNATTIVESLCLGRYSCNVPSGNGFWGDPCPGVPKHLAIRAHCSSGGGGPGGQGLDGSFAVAVDTNVHPDVDLVATRLACARTAGTQGCLTALRLALPYADGSWGASANNWDPTLDARHQTDVIARSPTSVLLMHYMDDFQAEVRCDWDDPAWTLNRVAPHAFTLAPPLDKATAVVQLSCLFAPAEAMYPVGNSGGPSNVAARGEHARPYTQ
jgi:hypothetical protein